MTDFNLTLNNTVSDALTHLETKLSAKVLRKTLIEITQPLLTTMKQSAPKQTGALRRSIRHATTLNRKNNQTRIRVGLQYKKTNRQGYVAGLMQERGTLNMPAQPFIQPAATLHLDEIKRDLATFIQQQLQV